MMKKESFDFHFHSWLSDGVDSPAEVCRRLAESGVTHGSMTDHDNILTKEQCRMLSEANNITLVPGCELSNYWIDPITHEEYINHLGGHFLLPQDSMLQQVLSHNQSQPYRTRITEMLYLCDKAGVKATEGIGIETACEMIMSAVPHSHHVGVREVSRFLVSRGCFKTIRDAYALVSRGGAAHVPVNKHLRFVPFKVAMEAITRTGLATQNHLHYAGQDKTSLALMLHEFKSLGGVGLETFYPRYDEQEMLRICRDYQFLPNAGSDSHDTSRPFLRGNIRYYRALEQCQLEYHGTLNL